MERCSGEVDWKESRPPPVEQKEDVFWQGKTQGIVECVRKECMRILRKHHSLILREGK